MRHRPLVACMILLLLALVGGAPVVHAAGSPEEAARALVERLESGALEDLDGIVCPEQHEEIRADLDPTASDPAMGEVGLEIRDPAVSLVSEEDGLAVVNVSATLRISYDETQLRDFIRAQLEATGQQPSDEEVETALQQMTALAGEDIPLDRDLTVVERDGEWLICDPGTSSGDFTDAGICGIVAPDEIGAVAPVAIGSNVGEGDFCQWIGADDTAYFSVDVGLIRGAELDDYRSGDPEARELTVGERPAIASFGQLYVAVDSGVLSVVPYLEDSPIAASTDPIDFAATVAELFIPRLGDLPEPSGGGGGAENDGGPLADCRVLRLRDINALGPLRYDTVSGADGSCVFSSTDPAALHVLSIGFDPTTSSVEDLRLAFPDGTAREVAGRAAYAAVDILWIELDEGMLAISPIFAGSPAAEGLDPYEYAADVARHVVRVIDS